MDSIRCLIEESEKLHRTVDDDAEVWSNDSSIPCSSVLRLPKVKVVLPIKTGPKKNFVVKTPPPALPVLPKCNCLVFKKLSRIAHTCESPSCFFKTLHERKRPHTPSNIAVPGKPGLMRYSKMNILYSPERYVIKRKIRNFSDQDRRVKVPMRKILH